MTQARQWTMLVRNREEPIAIVSRQYVTVTNGIEALTITKSIYANLLVSSGVFPADH